MARTVNAEEFAAKRGQILDIAGRHLDTVGYERLSIQDVRREIGMSNGAFYHYFTSKSALLIAYVERGQDELDGAFRAIVADPGLSAPEKFRRFFAALQQRRSDRRALIADLARVWFADDNAVVRERTDQVIVERRAPLLSAIVRQGVTEGVFTASHPDQVGRVVLAISRGMGEAVLRAMLALAEDPAAEQHLDEVVAGGAAMAEAIERVLGCTSALLERPDANTVRGWVAALTTERTST
ncbi:TetR/AcrR family transcriptional regulator [Pseudonocardia humida]|uniref:TetR/AcrR family transcriptional regulator n=1 Tax=Pseudonocardia humida TaxID=2800819 RepID=A0ABT1ACM1_9PSEU|nr:TetR/AcrR family transcriptional regulator [Pseudonocardia humida]MCO1660812.1 TetR/AcrR family transcriptional regulator [Pseudonocardia humida]